MNDQEIMQLYHGWDKEMVKSITRYVHKFHIPWSTYAPQVPELVDHCVKINTTLDDLPDNDEFYKKYVNENYLY